MKSLRGKQMIFFLDSFTQVMVGIKEHPAPVHTDKFLQLMVKYYGIDPTIYALCAFTFEVVKSEIKGKYEEAKTSD